MANTATTPPAGKPKRTPLPFKLLAAETIKSLMARAATLPADTVVYMEVPTPPSVRQDKPIRRDFDRGVLAELEAGNNVDVYNDRALTVAQMGEEFRFKAVVKEETIRKVSVKKV